MIAIVVCATVVCAAGVAAAGMSGAGAQDILTSRTADREQTILDGARKEGQVVLYSAAIVDQAQRPLAAAFMKNLPLSNDLLAWRHRGDRRQAFS